MLISTYGHFNKTDKIELIGFITNTRNTHDQQRLWSNIKTRQGSYQEPVSYIYLQNYALFQKHFQFRSIEIKHESKHNPIHWLFSFIILSRCLLIKTCTTAFNANGLIVSVNTPPLCMRVSLMALVTMRLNPNIKYDYTFKKEKQ